MPKSESIVVVFLSCSETAVITRHRHPLALTNHRKNRDRRERTPVPIHYYIERILRRYLDEHGIPRTTGECSPLRTSRPPQVDD